MIRQCETCMKFYDDEFRGTLCPHATFPANNGHNEFAKVEESYLGEAMAPRCQHEIADGSYLLLTVYRRCCKIAGHAGPHYTW